MSGVFDGFGSVSFINSQKISQRNIFRYIGKIRQFYSIIKITYYL